MTTGSTEQELDKAQRERFAATIVGDVPALERLMADDLIYVHSSARLDTKRNFIDTVVARGLPYRGFDIEEQQIRAFGDVGLISGVIMLTQRGEDGEHSHRSRCSSVWARRNGAWQQVFWQATRVPD